MTEQKIIMYRDKKPTLSALSGSVCLGLAALYALALTTVLAEETSVKREAKKVGNAVGSTAREVGQGAKQAGKEVGHGAKKVGKAVGDTAKEGVEAVKEGGKELKRAIIGDR